MGSAEIIADCLLQRGQCQEHPKADPVERSLQNYMSVYLEAILLILLSISSGPPLSDQASSLGLVCFATQPGRSWQAVVERGRIPQSFRRVRKCKFSRQKRRFLLLNGDRQFLVVKGLL